MTNREIAKQLGISPAALSLIINNRPGISDARRSEVLTRLQEMGYGDLIRKPAAPQKQSASQTICFAVYKTPGSTLDSSPFFMMILEGIENYARNFQYLVRYSFLEGDRPLYDQLKQLDDSGLAGLIVFATEMRAEDTAAFAALTTPYVFLDNSFPVMEEDCVSIDNRLGMSQAVSYLVSRGRKRIGYLRSEMRINSFEEREAGYRAALKEHGFMAREQDILTLPASEASCYQKMVTILSDHPDLPDAFVSDDDFLASGTMKALIESGYKVPDDISLVGFNDRPLCEAARPALTTIHVPRYSFGAAAVDLLHIRISRQDTAPSEQASLKAKIGTKLVIRGT